MSLTCGVLHLLSEVGGGSVVGYTVCRVKVVVALEGGGDEFTCGRRVNAATAYVMA